MPTVTALEQVISLIGDCTLLASDFMTEGLSPLELQAALQTYTDAKAAIADSAQILPEYLALNDAGRAELEAFVQANVTLPANVTGQSYIQAVLNFALALSVLSPVLQAKKAGLK